MTYDEVITCLYDLQDPDKVVFKEKKFGVVSHNSLGIYHKELKIIAKEIGRDNELALQLFESGIYEARLLCSKIYDPKELTSDLMEYWVVTFENWEICDSFCMGLFAKSSLALEKIHEWTSRRAEFEKRAGFATMAAYCMADKKSDNDLFEKFLPLLIREANDERLYVKKAVNWALRSIGKRNVDLNQRALDTAHKILTFDTKAANWIAKDAIRKLEAENVNILDYPRALYR
ncbi:DNA alkylation repair protein [Lutimonas sp.]|uniref:DNA alkylation repair protein n=1 Tax=Lutimonas sp. TaxID=1872403 RepID=UPI003D9B7176